MASSAKLGAYNLYQSQLVRKHDRQQMCTERRAQVQLAQYRIHVQIYVRSRRRRGSRIVRRQRALTNDDST